MLQRNSFRCNDVDAHGNEFKHFASKIALDNALKKHFDRSTILQSFAEQLNALTGPNDKVGGGLLSLSVPTQQNLYAIAHDCARVSEQQKVRFEANLAKFRILMKMMRVPVDSMEEIKPEPKKLRTLSRVQCAECDEIVSDSDASRLSHTNKHLKLCLYMCPVCHKQFMSTSNGGAGFCLQHIRQKHPEALLPSKAEISLRGFTRQNGAHPSACRGALRLG
uniref:C2H2-type domain-containing protein n=1 Tax=Globodera pallida TaxID=36090 RepID=A0A183CKL4_GLOPA